MVAGMPSSGRKLPRAVPPRRDGTGLPELHEAAVFGEVGRARKALAQGDHIDVGWMAARPSTRAASAGRRQVPPRERRRQGHAGGQESARLWTACRKPRVP